MNPLALLLLAAAAGGGRMPVSSVRSSSESAPVKLDTLVSQLQGAVNTLEKVGELSRMGNSLSSTMSSAPATLTAPASAHIPVSAEVMEESHDPSFQASPPSLPNLDLQKAMQTLGPLLSMLGSNQNPK